MILNSPTHYPVFKKGQPLRSDDLNDLISYLEAEELDTRVFYRHRYLLRTGAQLERE